MALTRENIDYVHTGPVEVCEMVGARHVRLVHPRSDRLVETADFLRDFFVGITQLPEFFH
jgi:hypothetical protein